MNDIKWHTKDDDDFYELLERYTNHPILVLTDVWAYRLSNTKYVNQFTWRLDDCNEAIRKFAFYEE